MITFTKPRRGVYAVYIHCSASDRPEHDDVTVIRQWHLTRGWSDVGYHFFIRKDGEVQAGRSLEKTPAAQRGYNTGSIAICLHGLREELFTIDQFNSLRDLCHTIGKQYTDMIFRGHCEVAAKSCPVFEYKSVLGLDTIGLMTGEQQDLTPIIADEYYSESILRIFDQGEHVRYLQKLLNHAGAYLIEDGIFGRATRIAVIEHQQINRLVIDGLVGFQTWESLSHFSGTNK